MIIGGIVKSINETCNLVFITVASEDGCEIQLRFKADDPRAAAFGFRANVLVDIEPAIDAQRPRLTVLR